MRWLLLLACLAGAWAGAAGPAPAMTGRMRLDHLLARATFGLTAPERERARALGEAAWLREQLHPPDQDPELEPRLHAHPHYLRTPGEVLGHEYARATTITASGERELDTVPLVQRLLERRLLLDVESRYQLRELLTEFWFNHFNVDCAKSDLVTWSLPAYVERDLRPRALGRFRDLLGAVARSTAMQVYLDNWISSAAEEGGLNENYARELLELHTLGVEAGYTQHDVREVARCFSGWTVRPLSGSPPDPLSGRFEFDPARHDDGAKTLMGELRIPAGGGVEDGERVLDWLARHPATARRIARKLARRFVGDDPPEAVVERAAATFLRTDGDLARVAETLLTAPELYETARFRGKVKTPLELVVSTARVLETRARPGAAGDYAPPRWLGPNPAEALSVLGTPAFRCALPIGYPDVAEAWDHPGSLHMRLYFAELAARGGAADLVRRRGLHTAEGLAAWILPAGASAVTLAAARRSADPVAAAAVLLASPEFRAR